MKYGHGKGGLDVARPASLAALFRQWPETRALAEDLVLIPFKTTEGAVEMGVETSSLIRVLKRLVEVGARSEDESLRQLSKAAAAWLPSICAFDEGSETVITEDGTKSCN